VRITVKGRYAVAAMIEIARQSRSAKYVSAVKVAEALGISKLFLEQTIAQLKKADLVHSVKGARGGYQIAKELSALSVYDILFAVENALFEQNDDTVGAASPSVEAALRDIVWRRLDGAVRERLASVTLAELVDFADARDDAASFMMSI